MLRAVAVCEKGSGEKSYDRVRIALAPRTAKVASVTRDPCIVRRCALPVIIKANNVLCVLVGELEWAEKANVRGWAAFELDMGPYLVGLLVMFLVCCVRVLVWLFLSVRVCA